MALAGIVTILTGNLKILKAPQRHEIDNKTLILPNMFYLIIILNIVNLMGYIVIEKQVSIILAEILLFCFFVSMFEELIFRGLIETIAGIQNKKEKDIFIAIIITSFLFGLSHFSYKNIALLISNIGLGFVLGTLLVKFQSLWIPILFHFIYDYSILASCSVKKQNSSIKELIKNCSNDTNNIWISVCIVIMSCLLSYVCLNNTWNVKRKRNK